MEIQTPTTGPPQGKEVGAWPPCLGSSGETVKVYTTEPIHPEIIYVKYYYEPTQQWYDIEISGEKTVAELRSSIFRQRFPTLLDVELKYMDALQIHYTKPFVNLDEPIPECWLLFDGTRHDVNDHRLPHKGKLENARYLNYSPYKSSGPIRADNYYVRVLDVFGDVWPVKFPPVAPLDVPKCMDTSLHMYEVDGLLEGKDYFVDNVLYYNGTLPAGWHNCNIRHYTKLGWHTSGKEVQDFIVKATTEAISYRIPDIEDISPAATLGYLAPCRLTGPGKRQRDSRLRDLHLREIRLISEIRQLRRSRAIGSTGTTRDLHLWEWRRICSPH